MHTNLVYNVMQVCLVYANKVFLLTYSSKIFTVSHWMISMGLLKIISLFPKCFLCMPQVVKTESQHQALHSVTNDRYTISHSRY